MNNNNNNKQLNNTNDSYNPNDNIANKHNTQTITKQHKLKQVMSITTIITTSKDNAILVISKPYKQANNDKCNNNYNNNTNKPQQS